MGERVNAVTLGVLWLVTAIVLIFVSAVLQLHGHDHATIAGLDVPAVHCQEDEVIGWIGVDTLGCINYEEVN